MKKEKFESLRTVAERNNLVARSAILAHKVDKKTIKKLLVLVEGVDDKPVYSVFLDVDKVDFKDCNGCLNVKNQHNTLKKELGAKFISILDSDFERMEGLKKHDDNLFYTDFHDSEMQMLSVKKVFYTAFKKLSNRQLYDNLILIAENELYNLSMLKWFNSKRNLRYRFEDMDLVNLSKGENLSVNTVIQYLTPSIKSPKSFPHNSFNTFLTTNDKRDNNAMLHQLTNGHDIILRLSGIMKHKYNCQVSKRELRDAICSSFTVAIARKSKLYADLKKWCTKENIMLMN